MNIYSYRTEHYRKLLDKLSPVHQENARQCFIRWAREEGAGSRRLNINSDVVSVKLDDGHRALGVVIDCPKPNSLAVVWFFVGKHSDYEHFMKASRLDASMTQVRDKLPKYRDAMNKNKGLVKIRPKAEL